MNFYRTYSYVFKFLNEHKKIMGILSIALLSTIVIIAIKIGQGIGKFIYEFIGSKYR